MENHLMIGKNVRLIRDIASEGGNPIVYSKHSICKVRKDLSFYCISGKMQGTILNTINEEFIDRHRGYISEPEGVFVGAPNMQLERDVDYILC